MARSDKKISELVEKVNRYNHSGEINSDVKDKDAVINKLKEEYSDGKIGELDGVKISYWDRPEGQRWWFNVRPSNTEPKLRLNLEADTQKLMEEKRDEILKIIRS
jgi:phosphomannomutase